MTDVLHIQSSNGVCFNVRIVRKGDSYGANNCLTHDNDNAMVEFYDHRYMHTPLGQFVSRYYASTLLDHDPQHGLDLDGGIPNWTVDAFAMMEVTKWIHNELGVNA